MNDVYCVLYGCDCFGVVLFLVVVEYDVRKGMVVLLEQMILLCVVCGESLQFEWVWLFDGEGCWCVLEVSMQFMVSVCEGDCIILVVIDDVIVFFEVEEEWCVFIVVVFYEFCNLLMVIIGYVDLFCECDDLLGWVLVQFEIIVNVGDCMQDFVISIFDQNGGMVQELFELVDLCEVVEVLVVLYVLFIFGN